MKLHRHTWIFARPAPYGGIVEVCSHERCPARRLREAPGDVRCGWCRGGRHDRCMACDCCTCVVTNRQEATA